MDTSIYESLYDIVEMNMKKGDEKMPCSKDAFIFSARMEPGVCDSQEMLAMYNDAFFEAAYMGLLNRLPDETAVKGWEVHMEQPIPKFREKLINALVCSPETILKGSSFRNNRVVTPEMREWSALNEYIETHRKLYAVRTDGQVMEGKPVKPGLKDHLYAIYIKLPLSFRRFVHKVLRRE